MLLLEVKAMRVEGDWGLYSGQRDSRGFLSIMKGQVSTTLPDEMLYSPEVHVWIQNLQTTENISKRVQTSFTQCNNEFGLFTNWEHRANYMILPETFSAVKH